jgi:PAS domain S-box-containing protein
VDFRQILQSVYGNSLDGIVITDRDTVIRDCNAAFEAATGYSREEVLGQKTSLIKSGLTQAHVYAEMWAGLNEQGRWVGELTNRRKDGSLWQSYLSITRVLGDEGQVAAYVGIARDITSRKEMEQRLRYHLVEMQGAREMADKQANRLRAILETVGEAILMVDNRGACVTANQSLGAVLGLPVDQIVGRSIHDLHTLCSRLFRGGSGLAWHAAPDGGPPVDIDTALLETREEPPRIFHEFSAPVQDVAGHVMGRIYVYRDITKETEVDRMKSEFIATVSHELRTPMTSVKGALGLVLGGVAGPLNDGVRELLDIARNNADRLIRLINDMLDIARIEAGKMEIRKAPVAIAEAVERAVRELQGFADQRQVQVTTVIDGALPRAMADADRLQQVLVNLLSNAVKFSGQGSTVTVTAGYATCEVWVRVEDAGPGIAPEHRDAIFAKFHRVDNASTRKTGGTGLGLAICKAIVLDHGGRIWVESEEGRGSAFTFSLPAQPEPTGPVVEEQAGARTVLVVDDDPDIVRLIRMSLEQEGYQTIGATSGEAALAVARTRRVDAITLDLFMPGMDGLEVVRQLKANPATAPIPVVVVSGHTEHRQAELGALGIAGIVPKPIDELQLLELIRERVADQREHRGAPTVLVVDDDADVRRIVRVMLQQQGLEVLAASDGQEAYRLIMEQRPDLLVLDLMMPGLDGFQLVRLLRQRRWTARIPLLVLTALDLTEGERTLLQLGPTRHVVKGPRIAEEVVARVRELLLSVRQGY